MADGTEQDPLLDKGTYWSVPMALAWAMTRNMNCVAEFHELRPTVGSIQKLLPATSAVVGLCEADWREAGLLQLPFRQAQDKLREALEKGSIRATGVPLDGVSPVRTINPGEWGKRPSEWGKSPTQLEFIDELGETRAKRDRGFGDGFRLVQMPVEHVLKAFPATPRRRSGGRKGGTARYHWPAFYKEVQRLLLEKGIPESIKPKWRPSDLENRMAEWCQQEWGKEPSHDVLTRRIKIAIEEFQAKPGRTDG